MQAAEARFSPGERMPFCAGLGADRRLFSLDGQAGRPAVLLVAGEAAAHGIEEVTEALAARLPAFAAARADLLLLLGPAAGLRALNRPDGAGPIPFVVCHDDPAGGEAAAWLVAIDRAGRIVASWRIGDGAADALAEAALHAMLRVGRGPAQDRLPEAPLLAPVLAIPRLLDAPLCAELIERFEAAATFESGLSGAGPDAVPRHRLDPDKKRRRDWLLEPGDGVYERALGMIARRCAPEMRRAFHHEASHADRVLVARYDENAGYFRRHRDNGAAAVAFRQFALSVNLNQGFEGGALMFPEYDDHPYRPGAGDGIVFSASLLHEATAVTRGRRYVLLTFLHDAEAERRRVAASSRQGCS